MDKLKRFHKHYFAPKGQKKRNFFFISRFVAVLLTQKKTNYILSVLKIYLTHFQTI